MSDLDILPVKSLPEYDQERFEKLNPILLKPPFLGVLNGSVRSGKSVLLMNLIYNKNFYRGLFDKIIFYSPTVMNDKTLKHLAEDDDVIKVYDNLHNVDAVFEQIVNDKMEDEETSEEQWLHIFDDMLGFINQKGFIASFTTKYRHSRNSMIFSTQLFRAIPNVIRTNATFYIIWKTNNKKEMAKLIEEFSGVIPKFKELYDEATQEAYNFLYLDLRHLKAYHNFTELLWHA